MTRRAFNATAGLIVAGAIVSFPTMFGLAGCSEDRPVQVGVDQRAGVSNPFDVMPLLVEAQSPASRPTQEQLPILCSQDAEALEKELASKYGEAPVAVAIINDQVMFSIYSSPDGGTWTAVTMGADGSICIVATGEKWIPVEPPPGETF